MTKFSYGFLLLFAIVVDPVSYLHITWLIFSLSLLWLHFTTHIRNWRVLCLAALSLTHYRHYAYFRPHRLTTIERACNREAKVGHIIFFLFDRLKVGFYLNLVASMTDWMNDDRALDNWNVWDNYHFAAVRRIFWDLLRVIQFIKKALELQHAASRTLSVVIIRFLSYINFILHLPHSLDYRTTSVNS